MEKIINKILDFVIGPAIAIWLELPYVFMKLMNVIAWLIYNRKNILAVGFLLTIVGYIIFQTCLDPVGTLVAFGTAFILVGILGVLTFIFNVIQNKIKNVYIWADNRVKKIVEEKK